MLRKKRRWSVFEESEDINPMNYIGNLSDAMLVLAVGLMLSLVMVKNIDISSNSSSTIDAADAQALTEELNSGSLTDEEQELKESDLQEYGTVYLDENGNYYVVEK